MKIEKSLMVIITSTYPFSLCKNVIISDAILTSNLSFYENLHSAVLLVLVAEQNVFYKHTACSVNSRFYFVQYMPLRGLANFRITNK